MEKITTKKGADKIARFERKTGQVHAYNLNTHNEKTAQIPLCYKRPSILRFMAKMLNNV